MKFGISTMLVRNQKNVSSTTVEETLESLYNGGFKNIDYSILTDFDEKSAEKFKKNDRWKNRYERLRLYAGEMGIKFHQTHNIITNYFDKSLKNDFNDKLVDYGLEITSLLGADCVVMHPVAPPGFENDRETCLRMNRNFFIEKAEKASRLGINIAVENMLSNRNFDGTITKRYCTNMEELVELVSAINHPNVGICVDVGHSHYMGHNIYEDILYCEKYLIATHIHDNNRFDDQHLTPYSGTLNWEKCFKGFADAGFKGVFSLEVYHICEKLPRELQIKFIQAISTLTKWMTTKIDKYGD